MAAAIGWYGPLIDLCKASSYIGDYVQLLVFVHKSTPIQYKIARNGGEVVRMDILVGDETRSYFPVTIWQKQMGSQVLAGHVFLLQSMLFVVISRLQDLEMLLKLGLSIVHLCNVCFTQTTLLHPRVLSLSLNMHASTCSFKLGLDELIGECRVGITARDKLQKVVGWLQRARLAHCGSVLNYYEHRRQLKINWKLHEEMHSQDCSSLSELCQCEDSCKATFHASVGEIFLPITWVNLQESEAERMFISRRLHMLGQNSLVDDLITTGCQLCGTPVNGRLGSNVEQNKIPLYCQRSSDRLHVVGTIYRPFLLYVWDDLKYLPISVTNKAAELLFGNIPAEKVYYSYKSQRPCQNRTAFKKNHSCEVHAARKVANYQLSSTEKILRMKDRKAGDGNLNFYMIWLILLNMLFEHGKNSPFKFKVTVDTNRDWENGRLEMVSVSLPAFRRIPSA